MKNKRLLWAVDIEVNYYGHAEIVISRRDVVGGIPREGKMKHKYFVDRAEVMHRAHRLQDALWDMEYNQNA